MRQVFRAGALGRPKGMGWGGRWEGASGWGNVNVNVNVNPWLIHVNVWQKPLQYCKVISPTNKNKWKKKKVESKKRKSSLTYPYIPITFFSPILPLS